MSVSVFRSLEEWEKKKTGIFTAVLPVQDAQKAAALHLIPEAIAHSCGNENVSKYESHEGFDFITIHVMDAGLISGNPRKLCIFFSKDYLLFFYSDSRLREQLDVYKRQRDGRAAHRPSFSGPGRRVFQPVCKTHR